MGTVVNFNKRELIRVHNGLCLLAGSQGRSQHVSKMETIRQFTQTSSGENECSCCFKMFINSLLVIFVFIFILSS